MGSTVLFAYMQFLSFSTIDIPFVIDTNNKLIVEICINKEKHLFMIDTGSDATYVDKTVVKNIKWSDESVTNGVIVINRAHKDDSEKMHRATVNAKFTDTRQNTYAINATIYSINLQTHNIIRYARGQPQIAGLIGSDFLIRFNSKIDYKTKSLQLQSMSFSTTLPPRP